MIVLDLRESEYFALNRSGAFLWEWLAAADHGQTELVSGLTTEFGVDQATAARDVAAFVDMLSDHQMLDV